MTHPFTQTFDQLPASLPVFPLSGAVVLPGGFLPLNIFEPRYLNMVEDAMRSDQLIGMIQPIDQQKVPALYSIGCVGRICRYEELHDGRLEITLRGLCRYQISKELTSVRGYRIVQPDWSNYPHDFDEVDEHDDTERQALLSALKRYFDIKNIDTDWEVMAKLNQSELVNNLFGYLPLEPQDKQLLIEAENLPDRIKSFIALLDRVQSQGNATRH